MNYYLETFDDRGWSAIGGYWHEGGLKQAQKYVNFYKLHGGRRHRVVNNMGDVVVDSNGARVALPDPNEVLTLDYSKLSKLGRLV